MPFWEANRKLLIGLALVLALVWAYWFFFVSPIRGETAELRDQIGNLKEAVRVYVDPDNPRAPDALKRMEAQRTALEAERKELGGMIFEVKAPYVLDPGVEASELPLERDRLVNALRARCAKSPVAFPAKAPLGFKGNNPQKEKIELALERLAVTARVVEAAERAGITAVRRLIQGKREDVSGASGAQLQRVPVTVSAQVTEESLVRLLAEISRPGAFLALESLDIRVARPDATHFEIKARVSGVLERTVRAPVGRAVGPLRRP